MDEQRSRGFTAASVPEAYDRWLAPQVFEPWARRLVARAQLAPGASVLDVATGPGTVALVAAAAVGPAGRVVAGDISAAMLAVAGAKARPASSASIEYREFPATALDVPDASFDAVLCQQGLQFFPDRPGALAEMHRVVRPGGVVAASVWASEHPLGLFGPIAEALERAGVNEPYPRAFVPQSYCLAADELTSLFAGAGLGDVVVETTTLDAVWPGIEDAVATVMGTPFAAAVQALPAEGQQRARSLLADRLGHAPDGTVTVRTTSHIVVARV